MTSPATFDRYRNIGIMASHDAGRTTTTERMLRVARRAKGVTSQMALPGFDELEERGITLTMAATGCSWVDHRVNIVELASEGDAIRPAMMAALDGLIIVLDGQPDYAFAKLLGTTREARLVFLNKMDRLCEGAGVPPGFYAFIDKLNEQAEGGIAYLPFQLPYGPGLNGLIDLVSLRATVWQPGDFDVAGAAAPIDETLIDTARAERAKLAAAVGMDDAAEEAALRAVLRQAVVTGRIAPVLAGSAFRNRGIDALLNMVVDYLPAPSELQDVKGLSGDGRAVQRRPSAEEPFSGVAFGKVADPAAGELIFLRVFSGVVATGSGILNTVSSNPEKIQRMVRLHANHAEEIGEARAGDIVAVAGLQHTATGDTLCDPAAPLILEQPPLQRVAASAGRA